MIDDESDYFSVDSNKWLTKEQREKLRLREEEIREGESVIFTSDSGIIPHSRATSLSTPCPMVLISHRNH